MIWPPGDLFRVWRGLKRFRGESRLTTWITRIAVNVSRNWVRSRRSTLPLAEYAESMLAAGSKPTSPRAGRGLWTGAQRLSPEQRAVFVLHETENGATRRLRGSWVSGRDGDEPPASGPGSLARRSSRSPRGVISMNADDPAWNWRTATMTASYPSISTRRRSPRARR